MGHSLGGYTSINLMNLRKDIKKAVVMSGFLSIESLAKSLLKVHLIVSIILKYERKTNPDYYDLNNLEFLKTTDKKFFFIQSTNDQVVPYSICFEKIEQIHRDNIKTLAVNNRKHNPNYTDSAVNYMDEVFGTYFHLIKKKKIKTGQDKINYFKDVPLSKLVEQDETIFDQIDQFFKD